MAGYATLVPALVFKTNGAYRKVLPGGFDSHSLPPFGHSTEKLMWLNRGVVLCVFAFGCAGTPESDDCTPFDGEIVFSQDEDQGTANGFIYWGDSVPMGASFEVGIEQIDESSQSYFGAAPDSWFVSTCGTEQAFYLRGLPVGTFDVLVRVQAEEQDPDPFADIVYIAEGRTELVSDNDNVEGLVIEVELLE